MKKLLGLFLGQLFLGMIIVGPLVGTVFYGEKIFFAFYKSSYKEAKIKDCYAIESRSGSTINRSWAPIALSVHSDVAKGNFGWKSKESCTEDIGEDVGMFVSSISPKLNQINTFFQLYFQFLISLGINLILYGAIYKGYKKKRREKLAAYNKN